jgi:putative thioredoxin
MTPRLEKRVKDAKGKLKLVHINIDAHGQIANHFKVKDVPTIFLVYMGRSIDSFTGEISD